jgi:hypothetical protein
MNDLLPLIILCSIPVCWFGAWWVMPKAILVPRWNLARCSCGYDRSGLALDAKCPECGHVQHAASRRQFPGLVKLMVGTIACVAVVAAGITTFATSQEDWWSAVLASVVASAFITAGLAPWIVFAVLGSEQARVRFTHLAAIGIAQAIALIGSAVLVAAEFSKDAQGGLAILGLPFIAASSGGLLALLIAASIRFLPQP